MCQEVRRRVLAVVGAKTCATCRRSSSVCMGNRVVQASECTYLPTYPSASSSELSIRCLDAEKIRGTYQVHHGALIRVEPLASCQTLLQIGVHVLQYHWVLSTSMIVEKLSGRPCSLPFPFSDSALLIRYLTSFSDPLHVHCTAHTYFPDILHTLYNRYPTCAPRTPTGCPQMALACSQINLLPMEISLVAFINLQPIDPLLHQLEDAEENCVNQTAAGHTDTQTLIHAAVKISHLRLLQRVFRRRCWGDS